MYEEKCPFCGIVKGSSKAQILFESRHSVAFLDINPINFGHTLVVSRNHFRDFSTLPDEVLNDLIHSLRLVSDALVDAVHPSGFNIFNNNGTAAGQTIFHFHFHVAPRFEGDGLRVKPQLKAYESQEQMAEYASKIRDKIKTRQTSE